MGDKFHTLRLAAAQGGTGLAQLEIIQPGITQRLERPSDPGKGREEIERLGHTEVQRLRNVPTAKLDVEGFAVEPQPATGLTPDVGRRQKAHLQFNDAGAGAFRTAAPRLWHVHLGDSNRLPPGDGHFDFALTVQTLRELRYTGYLSAELLARPDPDTAARKTIDFMRGLIPRN